MKRINKTQSWSFEKTNVLDIPLLSMSRGKERRYLSNVRDEKGSTGTSLVVQWLRTHLPMQGTWVQALVWEDPTCCGATKPMRHSYWACALEPTSHSCWAHALHLLKSTRLEPVLCNKRSHHNEKPMQCNKEWPPHAATRERPVCSNEDPAQPKINK